MKWYEKNKDRLIKEKEYRNKHIETKNSYNLDYGFFKDGKFYYCYCLEYKGIEFGALCIYPNQYPYKRIEVYIYEKREKSMKKFEFYNKGLHNSGGQLCLFGHNPDEWNSDYGIKEIIERVQQWFESRTI